MCIRSAFAALYRGLAVPLLCLALLSPSGAAAQDARDAQGKRGSQGAHPYCVPLDAVQALYPLSRRMMIDTDRYGFIMIYRRAIQAANEAIRAAPPAPAGVADVPGRSALRAVLVLHTELARTSELIDHFAARKVRDSVRWIKAQDSIDTARRILGCRAVTWSDRWQSVSDPIALSLGFLQAPQLRPLLLWVAAFAMILYARRKQNFVRRFNVFSRRSEPRFRCSLPVTLHLGTSVVTGRINDVSIRGCHMTTAEPLRPDIQAFIALPAGLGRDAKTVWTNGHHSGLLFCPPLHKESLQTVLTEDELGRAIARSRSLVRGKEKSAAPLSGTADRSAP